MNPPFQLAEMFNAMSLSQQLRIGMTLDRAEVKRLLAVIEASGSDLAGCQTMQAQLRGILDRKDWLRVHISSESLDALRSHGVTIGIAEVKPPTARKPRLSPLQKWQRQNRLGRAY